MYKKMRKITWFICLLVFSLLSTSCTYTKSKLGIIFSANIDGNQEIYYVADLDFKSIRRLTLTPNDSEKAIKVTKDGRRILFYVPGPEMDRINSESLTPPSTYAHTYVLNLESNITSEMGDSLNLNPTIPLGWSVDENRIVLSEVSTRKVYMVDPSKKRRVELVIPPSGVSELFSLSFSPDGQQILYTVVNKYSDPAFTSFFYDLDTKTIVQLGNHKANCMYSAWSPIGNQILLLCDLSFDGISPNYHVYIINRDNISLNEIVDFPQCNTPDWSPDGKKILMVCTKGTYREIILVNSDGSEFRKIEINLSDGLSHIWELSWAPDGQRFLYIAGESQDLSKIYVSDIDGSNNFSVSTQVANYSDLAIFTIP